MQTLSKKMADKLKVVKIDVDKYPKIAARYGIEVRCMLQQTPLYIAAGATFYAITGLIASCTSHFIEYHALCFNSMMLCLRLQALPTLVVFKDGQQKDRIEGDAIGPVLLNGQHLEERLQYLLFQHAPK